ncbi:hypothetical protein [Orbus mooreae]|uniref:hypothetical protein n=1 Tax=Orbus mooreae TaxID=3074107 RepID=UPI00370D92D9
MLKRLRLLILLLIAILWFVIIFPYLLIQTEFGAGYAGKLLSHYNDNYSISIGNVSHSIFKPYEIELENFTIQDKAKTVTYLSAQKMVVVLQKNNLLQSHSFDYVLIENGYVQSSATLPVLNSNILQLKNISLKYSTPKQDNQIALNNISGSIAPWSSQWMSERLDSQFTLTVENANYNQLNIDAIFIQGTQKDKVLTLSNVGGNIAHGFFTMKGHILANNHLNISQLRLNNISSQIDTSNIDDLSADLPETTIAQLSIINSSIVTPKFSIEKGNLDVKNVNYSNTWHIEKSDLAFNAQSIVWNNELIEAPLLKWYYDNDKIIVEQAMATWNHGNIKLSGRWQNDKLTIDNIIAVGLRYELPESWYQSLSSLPLTDYFPTDIVIKQFALMPSLIINTAPNFPFQFTAFEAFGNDINVHITKDELHIAGKVLVKADSGTLNTVELNKPDLTLSLTPTNSTAAFSTLINSGVLEGNATLLTTKQLQSLTLDAYNVSSQILPLWHLINNPISANKYTLELHGDLQPLSLEGQFSTDEKTYSIKNNQFVDY